VIRDATTSSDTAVGTVDVAAAESPTGTAGSIFLFHVEADPEPDVFARIANVFNIANTAPQHASLRRDSPHVIQVTVAIELPGVGVSEMIRRKLEQLTSTVSVEVLVGASD
jgi:glycine cleavage system regulatory protein